MIKVGIVGGSGYVAGELIRCLIHHPNVAIDFVFSHSHAGKDVGDIHQDLAHVNLALTDKVNEAVDVVFLCLGHGNSSLFLQKYIFSSETKVIDLSNDFRLKATAHFSDREFVYGLVELNKKQIQKAKNIANPGCFATAIQLGLLPLAQHNLLKKSIHIHAITGATGAGQSPSATTHFSWRNNNVSIYKAFSHQHLDEIKESIIYCQKGFSQAINFIPVRGNFSRGIFASIYTESSLSEKELITIFKNFYKNEPFTYITNKAIHLKQVVNTNNCYIQLQKHGNNVLITSIIDNLLKGAAGQAIQNMNLMFGIAEETGLHFKANYL